MSGAASLRPHGETRIAKGTWRADWTASSNAACQGIDVIKLDILSDPICPWCMIGKANLDRALLDRPDHPFEIE